MVLLWWHFSFRGRMALVRPLRDLASFLLLGRLWLDHGSPLSSVHLCKSGRVYLVPKKRSIKFTWVTDLRWRTWLSYLRALGVGSDPLQYQWMVSSVTNLAQVLSSGFALAKKFSGKLHCSSVTCGRSRTTNMRTVKVIWKIKEIELLFKRLVH